ncbi:MAG TPA: PfkB family carbohydrate kinase [Rugosimonospora sp.]|nr:PfkB family carbohydrate kinase [Rugosimonospora sp.]
MTADTRVLVLGGTGVDTVVYIPRLGVAGIDSCVVPAIVRRAGQTGDNVAVGLAALGLPVSLIDHVGDDHEGELVRALHRRSGVSLMPVDAPHGTKRAVSLVDPSGRRLSFFDGSRTAGDPLPEELVAQLAEPATHAHVSITFPCQHALPTLIRSGVVISTDLHDWNGSDAYHEEFAYQADIVFLSAVALTDHEATMRRIVERGRARVVVATAGARGGYVLAEGDGAVRAFAAATPPAPVVDSNGAGDAFATGFLFGQLSGADLDTCLAYGTVAGAHAVTVPATEVDPIGRDALLRLGR